MNTNGDRPHTLFLHAGMPKTGSTGLQRFLLDNVERFRELGFLIPFKGMHRADQHRYSWKSAEGVACYTSPLLDLPPTDRYWEKLGEDPEATAYDLLISAEGFYWDFKPDQATRSLEKIRSCLPGHRIRILVYLRDELDLMRSIRNEWVKTGFMLNNRYTDIRRPEEDSDRAFFGAFLTAGLCAYDAWVENLAGLVGRENLVVRLYDRRRLVGGDIARDLLDAMGVDTAEGFQFRSDDANPRVQDGPTYSLLAGLGRATHDLPHRSRARLNALVRQWSGTQGSTAPSDVDGGTLEADLAQVVAANDTLCRDWFPDRQSLFDRALPDRISGQDTDPDGSSSEIGNDQTIRIIAGLWRGQEAETVASNLETAAALDHARLLATQLRSHGHELPPFPEPQDGASLEAEEAVWRRKLSRLGLILLTEGIGSLALWGYNDLAVIYHDNLGNAVRVPFFIDRKAGWQNLDDHRRQVPVVTLEGADLESVDAVLLCTQTATGEMRNELEARGFRGRIIAHESI